MKNGNGRALVVVADDDPDIRELVAFSLERGGYAVVKAADGEQALRLALAHEPAAVLLDVKMPKLDGCEVTELLRQQEATRTTPIVLITASVENAQIERGMRAGANDYIQKPFSPQELRARVDAIVARQAG